MLKENNLPKYWAVKIDTSNPYWSKVVDYLNFIYGRIHYDGLAPNCYYGFDGEGDKKGIHCFLTMDKFKNNPKLLTIKQFVEMTEGIKKTKFIPEGTPCLVRDNIYSNWMLAYSLGDGTYQGQLAIKTRQHVQVLDINNLPKY